MVEENIEQEKIEPISNDKILDSEINYTVVEQEDETLLSYTIDGLYKNIDTKKFNARSKLEKEPPILTIKDSNGGEVRFTLTEYFTEDLLFSLKEVNHAYNGYKYTTDKKRALPILEQIKEIPTVFKKHPIKFSMTILSIILLAYLLLAF